LSKILLVDDDEQVRTMLRLTLEREGHEVVEAADGQVALALFHDHEIDLVVTDILMPEKEGIELIMDLKAIDRNLDIIAISGGGRMDPAEYLNWARRFGVKHTFVKPVARQELLGAVDSLLAVGV